MTVSRRFRHWRGQGGEACGWRGVAAALLLACWCVPGWSAKPNDPALVIPLEGLGFPSFTGVMAQFLMGRATMYTVNFVDASHVLLTYNSRSLMARLPDVTPQDDDRTVTALLLELPSGKVVAKTNWRTRDRDQYLYPLGHGRFLLRVRSKLAVLDPLRALKSGRGAFEQKPFLVFERPIGFVSVSAAADLLTVETVPRERDKEIEIVGAADALTAEQEARDRRVPVQMHFYRLVDDQSGVTATSAGLIYSPSLLNVPATSDGFLRISKESTSVYDLDFKPHGGKLQELAAFETSCLPSLSFVSRSEFVAFGCRGANEKAELSEFNLRGEEPWVSTFTEPSVGAQIVAAPAAGRFALERLLVSPGFVDTENLTSELVTSQEVRVMQNHDGRILLKTTVSPYQRTGQNFDLSEDGSLLVSVNGGNLLVYRLPGLSNKDKSEVARASEANPKATTAMILLDAEPVRGKAEAKSEGVKVGTEVVQPAAGKVVPPPVAEPATAAAAEPNTSVVGDVPEERRKAPSLYDDQHPKPPSL